MSSKANASKKSQQLKRKPERKTDEEVELSEKEVRNTVKRNKSHPKHLTNEETRQTEQTRLRRVKIASSRRKTWQPLSPGSRKYMETVMETVIIGILSNKGRKNEQIQYHLNCLKRRLLQLCETLKVPPQKLKDLTRVSRLLQMERELHRTNEEGLALLQEEVDKIVETTESVTESIQSLQDKIHLLTSEVKEEEEKAKQMFQIDSRGVLSLPELSSKSLKAPILQKEILAQIPNPNSLLKDFEVLHNSSQMKSLLNFIEEAYRRLGAS